MTEPRFKVNDFVRIRGRDWVAVVLEVVSKPANRHHYRIFPVAPRPLEWSYWWSQYDLEPASILEAIAEAANGEDDVPTG